MARYILLEFDDNVEADTLVKAVQDGQLFISPSPGSMHRLYSPEVRALWFKPTLFCECAVKGERLVRGEKWGMMVCIVCHKPRQGHCQHPRNLLDPAEMPLIMRTEYLGIYEPAVRGGVAWEEAGRPTIWQKTLEVAKRLGTRS